MPLRCAPSTDTVPSKCWKVRIHPDGQQRVAGIASGLCLRYDLHGIAAFGARLSNCLHAVPDDAEVGQMLLLSANLRRNDFSHLQRVQVQSCCVLHCLLQLRIAPAPATRKEQHDVFHMYRTTVSIVRAKRLAKKDFTSFTERFQLSKI